MGEISKALVLISVGPGPDGVEYLEMEVLPQLGSDGPQSKAQEVASFMVADIEARMLDFLRRRTGN